MHFATLYLLRGEVLENTNLGTIEEDFCSRFCYCCGETKPKYEYWCDWFQIGGRWSDIFKASRGHRGEPSLLFDQNELDEINAQVSHYSVVEIKDLTENINPDSIYAVATKSKIYKKDDDDGKFFRIIDDINRNRIKGVIALIDCHD